MINRLERKQRIHSKGFDFQMSNENNDRIIPMSNNGSIDFSKIKVGVKKLNDATIEFSELKKVNPRLADRKTVLKAIATADYVKMREISNFFFKTSGIYRRLCKYMANMYRYDWMIIPQIGVTSTPPKDEKIIETFHKALSFCDDFEIKKFCGDVALKVIRNGVYYGYAIEGPDSIQIQELPPNYCRSRYSINGRPAIEFKMSFFDDYYSDENMRERALKLFPKEFLKGYRLFKAGKLHPDYSGDDVGWYLLDPEFAIRFDLDGELFPPFIAVIPAIIDLDNALGLDKKKLEQQLLKIIIQKMPIDKNGDLVFDVDEAQALHNNAVKMIGRAVGIDVLTTFADVEVANMAENNNTNSDDILERTKSAVFDQAGISQLQFNSTTNIALNNSILNDEASMSNLLWQFENFVNKILLKRFNKNPKKIKYRAQFLTTTIYNYKELAKLYKEQTQLGYSKFLPQIALGQSQSVILASAKFENEILNLVEVFVPPMSSNTMSGGYVGNGKVQSKTSSSSTTTTVKETEKVGRKELDDTQKSDKTIANRESISE